MQTVVLFSKYVKFSIAYIEYKMLLFEHIFKNFFGCDIIYIISKPPNDSAHGLYRFKNRILIGGYNYVYLQTKGWSILAIPFFYSK